MHSAPLAKASRLGLDVELRAIRHTGVRFPHHWHEDLQVIASVVGAGEAIIGDARFALPEGALVIVPPRVAHTAFAIEGQSWTFLSLHASPRRLSSMLSSPVVAGGGRGDQLAEAFHQTVRALFDRRGHPAVEFSAFLAAVKAREVDRSEVKIDQRLLEARLDLARNFEVGLTVLEVARRHGYSPAHFSRAFKTAFFMSPHSWRVNARIEHAKHRLREGASVSLAAAAAGFDDLSNFSRTYRARTGITARTYASRRGGARS